MRKRIYNSGLAAFLLLTIVFNVSCKKTDIKTDNELSFAEIFDLFWQGINSKYVYWYNDPLDWKSIQIEYRTGFEKLDIKNHLDHVRASEYFNEIISLMMDGHLYIEFHQKDLSGLRIYSDKSKTSITGSHLTNPHGFVNDQYRYAKGDDGSQALIGRMKNEVYYIGMDRFSMSKVLSFENYSTLKSVYSSILEDFGNPHVNTNKIIWDLRDNVGGELADLNLILPYLIDSPLKIGYTRHKSDPNKLSYTPWQAKIIQPYYKHLLQQKVIVILINSNTASLGEIFSIALSDLPYVHVIGERSSGKTGIQADSNLYYSGSFTIGNFMTVNLSSLDFRSANNISYEGVGFEPDIALSREQVQDTNRDFFIEIAHNILK